MSDILVRVNGKDEMVGPAYELNREALAAICTTQNIGSKTVKSALDALDKLGGAKLFAGAIVKVWKPGDTLEIHEGEKLTARGKVGNIANRINIALDRDAWSVEIFTEKSEKKTAEGVTQVMFGVTA